MGEIYVSKIDVIRKEKGLTQLELAQIVGVDPSTIRNWERNRGFLDTLIKVKRLCEALECSVSDLVAVEELNSEA